LPTEVSAIASTMWICFGHAGHLVGSGKFRMDHQLVRKGLRNGMLASCALALMAAAGAPWLMHVFTRDPAVIAMAQTLLWISFALETGASPTSSSSARCAPPAT
jgi:Na+-driven multidrug efflux pump